MPRGGKGLLSALRALDAVQQCEHQIRGVRAVEGLSEHCCRQERRVWAGRRLLPALLQSAALPMRVRYAGGFSGPGGLAGSCAKYFSVT